jgi:hypothetical protein
MLRAVFVLPFTKQNKLKMKTALFLRQSFFFSLHLMYATSKTRIDFYASQNVRKKAGSKTKAINDNMWV